MIKIKNVYKKLGAKYALEDFSLDIEKESIFALVGPNGAGKTTILKHIMGIYKPDSGHIEIADEEIYDNEEMKQKLAFVPDNLDYYNSYKAGELMRIFSEYYNTFDSAFCKDALNSFELPRDIRLRSFSKGMRKQAIFALVLATEPEYLILDEPIDGLDPLMRKKVWRYIVEATKDRKMTTLVSSHNLKEMDGICDSVAIMKKGRVVLDKKLDDLKSSIRKIQIAYDKDKKNRPNYKELDVIRIEKQGAVDVVIAKNGEKELAAFEKKHKPVLFNSIPLTLEEIFIYEIGGKNEIESII
jgi:ABC-2 type transport system ATP-binding protein